MPCSTGRQAGRTGQAKPAATLPPPTCASLQAKLTCSTERVPFLSTFGAAWRGGARCLRSSCVAVTAWAWRSSASSSLCCARQRQCAPVVPQVD